MESNISIIAKVIQAKFNLSNKTKKDITEETGLSLNTINNALQGKNLTLNTLFKILECFNMSIEDMVAEANKQGLKFPKPTPNGPVDKASIVSMIENDQSVLDVSNTLDVSEGDVIDAVIDVVRKSKLPAEVYEA